MGSETATQGATQATESATTTAEVVAPAAAGKARLSRAELMAKLLKGAEPDTVAPAGETQPAEVSASDSAKTSDATPSEAADQAAEAAEAAVAEETPKQPNESQRQYDHRIAQAMLKAQRAESEALTHKRTADTQSARVKELEALLESLAGDPVKALAHAKSDPASLAQMMLDGKLRASDAPPKVELPPEVQELIEQGKAAKARAAQEAQAKEAASVRAENVRIVDQARQAAVAEFPVLAAVASEGLLSVYEAVTAERNGVEPDFREVAELAQKRVLSDLTRYLSDASVLKLVLGNADVKGLLAKELGLPQAAAPKSEGAPKPAAQPAEPKTQEPSPAAAATPSTITNRDVSRVPSRSGGKSSSSELAAKINRDILGR